MKIHSIIDLVTNSSSSTFIVGFDKIPKTLGEMFDMLFPNGEEYVSNWGDSISSAEAAQIIFRDLKDSLKIETKEDFYEEVSYGVDTDTWEDYQELYKIDGKYKEKYGKKSFWEDHVDWKEKRSEIENRIDNKREIAIKKFVDEKWEEFKDLNLFAFTYGDHGSTAQQVLEQGDVFRNLPNIYISNH